MSNNRNWQLLCPSEMLPTRLQPSKITLEIISRISCNVITIQLTSAM